MGRYYGETNSTVLFVASLACYDRVDYSINAMTEQLELFRLVVQNRFLMTPSIILFLNKKDLFAEKIKRVPLNVCKSFSTYKGKRDSFDETTEYIRGEFISLDKRADEREIFTHITCALDSDNVQKVF